MKCKEVERKMAAFICGDLTPHEEKILRNHIQNCHECKQMLNKFNMLKNTMKKIELNREEVFVKNTMSRINELQQRRFTYRYRDIFKSIFKKRKWIAHAITVLLFLIIFGYVLGFFNIFIKPQEVNAQEILIKSLKFPEEIPEEIKSIHRKETHISYPHYNLDYNYKQEEKKKVGLKLQINSEEFE
jgi:predicted anti-sigma-YlaC factor YlaD